VIPNPFEDYVNSGTVIESTSTGREAYCFHGDLYYDEEDYVCEECHCYMNRHDTYHIRLRHVCMEEKLTYVMVDKHRFMCPQCGHYKMQQIPFQADGHHITNELLTQVESMLSNGFTNKQISGLTGLHQATIKDIDKKINRCVYKVESINGVKSIYTESDPNGIAYFNLGFDATKIPKRLLPALSILKSQLGLMDTKSYTYGDLVNETYIKTGMIYYNTMIYKDVSKPNDYTVNFEVKSRTLYEFLPDAFNLIKEVLFTSKLDDKKRLKENLEQSKVRIQGFFLQAGHSVAAGRALSSISDSSALMDVLSGMGYYRFIEDTLLNFDEAADKLIKDMKEVLSLLITKDNLEISYGADHKNKKAFCKAVSDFVDTLPEKSKATKPIHMKAVKGSEAFSSASMVNYAAVSGNFVAKSGLEYNGSLLVSSKILNNEYLWNEVRLKGGAYGCFCSFRSNGEAVLASFRDPNLKKTFKVFSKVSDFLKKYDGSKEDVDRYIISTIGDLDLPLTTSMKVARSYIFYKTNTTNAIKQKERNEILSTTKEVINASSKYVDAFYKNKAYSCVGSEEKLKSEGKMFNVITPLFKA
ncbi:MAG: hypothetical protein IJM28_00500, partial [Lachnospiraceae bacterium]|nr:hypothetical protein [Lachnospiraceae bacterium]